MNAPGARKQRRVMEVSTDVVPAMESLLAIAVKPNADRTAVIAAAEKVKSYLTLRDDGVTLRQKRGFRIRLWVELAIAGGTRAAPAPVRDWLLARGIPQSELPAERMFRKAIRELGHPPA